MPRLPLSAAVSRELPDVPDLPHVADATAHAAPRITTGALPSPDQSADSADLPGRMRFDLTTVRLFIATAELGGITHAAHSLFLVPAAASRRIRELEAQLGLPLFD